MSYTHFILPSFLKIACEKVFCLINQFQIPKHYTCLIFELHPRSPNFIYCYKILVFSKHTLIQCLLIVLYSRKTTYDSHFILWASIVLVFVCTVIVFVETWIASLRVTLSICESYMSLPSLPIYWQQPRCLVTSDTRWECRTSNAVEQLYVSYGCVYKCECVCVISRYAYLLKQLAAFYVKALNL